MTIRKAVIAVAGFGTRFLPASKCIPKELMPIVDKPVIQYLVEEAVSSGIRDVIFVVRPGTQMIADHFDSSRELEIHLEETQKTHYLRIVQELPKIANFAVVRQGRHLPYGNGTPILAAMEFLGRHEPFVYMFGDDLVLAGRGQKPCLTQLIEAYERYEPAAVIAVQDVPLSETNRYGIVKVKPGTDPMEMESIVEKPAPGQAPSTLAQFGRFVLTPKILDIISKKELGLGGELYLTDAIAKLCREDRVLVQRVIGRWHTVGDPLRHLITSVEYALTHPEIGPDFAQYLRGIDWSHRDDPGPGPTN
jgi:UTP--glucose-1-phosphate uridylyltransferase